MPKTKTYMGNLIAQNNIDKLNSGVALLDKLKYGVILNKRYNQYIMINFVMDYRNYNQNQK
jgi:hypothetical protein